jgi:aspartyl-tRNA(Asn)/glutamyl-tRNA(Gln) amidotransferase subunit B
MSYQQLKKYKLVVGLEVHAQLQTKSKIFCADDTRYGQPPNHQISIISLAHPGTLPKVNKVVFEYAIKMGLACNSEISRHNIFDRKNYFYPDLPKGYQITQDRTPVCKGGQVNITTRDGNSKSILLNRIHLEEDAGKSIHLEEEIDTLLDFNRAGVPLIEIVTEPVIYSSEEAYAFLTEIRKLVRYLNICDGNMEEGSLRCDANVSVMCEDDTQLGKKVEVKNMNSIRHVQRAIDVEATRQINLLEAGEQVISETRTFDADSGQTYSMRTKEELNDYRYFPDPDLSPVIVSDEWLNQIKSDMPALPEELYQKFITVYQLPAYDARLLTETKEFAAYFESVSLYSKNYKAIRNWLMGPVKSYLNDKAIEISQFSLDASLMASLIDLVELGKISFSAASQKLFPVLIDSKNISLILLAQELNLLQDSNEEVITDIVNQIIIEFPDKVLTYRKGKKGILAFLMGELMKRTKGKADPKLANDILTKKLNSNE